MIPSESNRNECTAQQCFTVDQFSEFLSSPSATLNDMVVTFLPGDFVIKRPVRISGTYKVFFRGSIGSSLYYQPEDCQQTEDECIGVPDVTQTDLPEACCSMFKLRFVVYVRISGLQITLLGNSISGLIF